MMMIIIIVIIIIIFSFLSPTTKKKNKGIKLDVIELQLMILFYDDFYLLSG